MYSGSSNTTTSTLNQFPTSIVKKCIGSVNNQKLTYKKLPLSSRKEKQPEFDFLKKNTLCTAKINSYPKDRIT